MTPGVVTGMAEHAAIYARQSFGRENGSEASTATQREQGIETAKRRGCAHYAVYEDLGFSAFTGKERPDYERMLNDCRMGRINVIIVYYISRFSRADPLDAIPVVTELLNLGVTIVSVTEGEFRKGNLMDLIHLIMRLDAAHNESKNKSIAVKGAKAAAKALGGFVGGKPPYGFRLVPKTVTNEAGRPIVIQKLAHNEDEAALVRRVVATIKAHKDIPYIPSVTLGSYHPGSLSGIAKTLNDEKVDTRGVNFTKKKVGGWTPSHLMRMLRDPRIAGYGADVVYKTREDGTRQSIVEGYRIQRDPKTGLPVQICTPIISPEEWFEIQAWLETRGRGKGLGRHQTLLSAMSVLHCECGSVMVGHTNAKTGQSNYKCNRKTQHVPGQHAGTVSVSQPVLDEYMARRIFARIATADDDPETLDMLAEAARRFGRAKEAPERVGERAALVADRADAVRALEELYEDRKAGGYSGPIGRKAFLAEEAELNARMLAAEDRIKALEANDTPALPIGEWMPEDPDADPIGEGSWWYGADTAARRHFVSLFLDRVTIHKASGRGKNVSPIETRVKIEWAQTPAVDADDMTDAA